METIVAVAPNGGRRTKADHPCLPVTAEEIAREAGAWCEAGAAVLHLHVRDADQGHSLDAGLYRGAMAAVRRETNDNLVIQITTEAVGRFGRDAQMAAARAVRPQAVSLALRELAPGEDDKAGFGAFLDWLAKERIAPQIILHDRDDAVRAGRWAREGVFDATGVSILYVLGRYAPPTDGELADLAALRTDDEGPFRDWMLCAFGRNETACLVDAAGRGGHVRVGFENNLHLPDGRLAGSNAELVLATTKVLTEAGRTLATADEVRRRWGIAR